VPKEENGEPCRKQFQESRMLVDALASPPLAFEDSQLRQFREIFRSGLARGDAGIHEELNLAAGLGEDGFASSGKQAREDSFVRHRARGWPNRPQIAGMRRVTQTAVPSTTASRDRPRGFQRAPRGFCGAGGNHRL